MNLLEESRGKMGERFVCLKQYMNQEDYNKIEELRRICTDKEDIFLKLELDFKLNISKMQNIDSIEIINEFFYYFDEVLVGYLGIFCLDGETCELTGMVHPCYRRKGIFKKLYSLAQYECMKRKANKVLLVCDNKSDSGLSFIKSVGAVYVSSEYEMIMDSQFISEEKNNINLRKALNSDANEIAYQNSLYFGIESNIEVLLDDDEKRSRTTYIIESDFKMIGKISVECTEDEGFISGFGILPEYRHMGFGKKALKSTLSILKNKNVKTIKLEVATQNKNALSLYESCGFSIESITDYFEVTTSLT